MWWWMLWSANWGAIGVAHVRAQGLDPWTGRPTHN